MAIYRKKSGVQMNKTHTKHIIVGDIHGEFDGFTRILKHAGLIDEQMVWSGKDSILVQTGDVIDRGPHSWKCVKLLRTLQQQAASFGGQVIRLCGNHELMLMEDPHNHYANFADTELLTTELREEIRTGRVQACFTDNIWLFTHAGLRTEIRMALQKEIGTKSGSLNQLAEHINTVFMNAVAHGDLQTHPIFHVDRVRGGHHNVGGIFWGDYSLISNSLKAYDIPQIFGHTPTGKKGIQHAYNFRLIDIDAGMYSGYGGNLLYLETYGRDLIKQHIEYNGTWIETSIIPSCS